MCGVTTTKIYTRPPILTGEDAGGVTTVMATYYTVRAATTP
jgi:hypothetical protein